MPKPVTLKDVEAAHIIALRAYGQWTERVYVEARRDNRSDDGLARLKRLAAEAGQATKAFQSVVRAYGRSQRQAGAKRAARSARAAQEQG